MSLVSCSNCGREFSIEGQPYGFSHCDQHAHYQPVPDEGFVVVVPPGGWPAQAISDHPVERYTIAAAQFAARAGSDEVFMLFDAAAALPDKWDEAARMLCTRLRQHYAPGPREAVMVTIRAIRDQWGLEPKLPLAKVNLAGCDQLVAADLSHADLSAADLRGADLSEANLTGSTLSSVKAAGIKFHATNLTDTDLESADLRGAILTEAILDGANLTYADLRGAQFGKGIWNVNLTGADLRGAEFDTDAYLETSTLDQARLDGLELTGATLGSANKAWMRGINLYNARLASAHLVQSRISSANLCGADLSGAYLREAWLDGANLTGANLCGADLTAADLTNAVLKDIRWDKATRWPANITPPPSS